MILDGAPPSWTSDMRVVALAIADDARDPSQGMPDDGWPWSKIRLRGNADNGEWHDDLIERTGLNERAISRALTNLARAGYEMREPISTDCRGRPLFTMPGRRAMRFRVPRLTPRPHGSPNTASRADADGSPDMASRDEADGSPNTASRDYGSPNTATFRVTPEVADDGSPNTVSYGSPNTASYGSPNTATISFPDPSQNPSQEDPSLRTPGASAGSGVLKVEVDNKALTVTRGRESLDLADESWAGDEPGEPDDAEPEPGWPYPEDLSDDELVDAGERPELWAGVEVVDPAMAVGDDFAF